MTHDDWLRAFAAVCFALATGLHLYWRVRRARRMIGRLQRRDRR